MRRAGLPTRYLAPVTDSSRDRPPTRSRATSSIMEFSVEKCANQGTRRSNHADMAMIDGKPGRRPGGRNGRRGGRGSVLGGAAGAACSTRTAGRTPPRITAIMPERRSATTCQNTRPSAGDRRGQRDAERPVAARAEEADLAGALGDLARPAGPPGAGRCGGRRTRSSRRTSAHSRPDRTSATVPTHSTLRRARRRSTRRRRPQRRTGTRRRCRRAGTRSSSPPPHARWSSARAWSANGSVVVA